MESLNFDFLAKHDGRLVTLGGLAERYFRDDPSTAIVKLRQFAELMTKLVAAHHAVYRDERESFEETLRRLSYDRLIPKEAADIFHALRKAGNTAVHELKGNHATALTALKLAWSLGIWFHRTYGRDAAFSAGAFVPPPEPVDATAALREEIEALRYKVAETEDAATRARREVEGHARAREAIEERLKREAEERATWEALAQEVEAEKAAIADKLAALQTTAEAAPRMELISLVELGEQAAAKIDLDEAETRALIDQQLRDRGWEVDTGSLRYSAGVRPTKGRNMAIAEWPTASGPADYALFVGTTLVGVVEAKRRRKNVSAAIDQAERYSVGIKDSADFAFAGGPWGDHKVPFVFAANGRSYLKQIETESGIWFRDTRRAANHRRALVAWPTPDGLSGLLEVDQDAADAALKAQPFEFGFPLRHYQESAIRAVEKALSAEQRAMLVAMATGTGKTKLAIAMLYRLLSAKRFRRICFVVDRSALGDQTEGEFSTTKVVSGKTFAEIFGLKGLGDVAPDVETKVHICTIQGLVKRVLFAADTSEAPPVDQYDLMVIDECHRGYLLDREMSDAELSFRGQDDYISKYRRVLDYFDAVKVGLTATPALHTTEIFGDPIFKYSYREAVFLKMLEETGKEDRLPDGYRWGILAKREGMEQLDYYKAMLLELGKAKDGLVRAIFIDAQTRLRKPTNLKALTSNIDQLDWFSAREEGLGNLYEGLLEKNASDKKSGAGQYFTPRPLIDCIVRLMQPQPGEIVQDPAAGTAGFLVAADRYIKDHTDDLYKLPEAKAFFQRHNAFVGAELVPDTHRLCMMNLLLHGIEGGVENIDTLSPDGEALPKANLILTNPPFGTKKGGGRPTRSDFSITADTSNKQLAFVEHIVRALEPGGRAAVVVPDNVLFEDNTGRRLRTWLMDLCDLHTILRLPTGIFYAQGVKTNVLFFRRGKADKGNTKAVWVYDMRANMPAFGKTRPLTVADFADFEAAFGSDPNGGAERQDQGEGSRWRKFDRKAIAARNDNLDITLLRDTEIEAEEKLTEPEDISAAIIGHLRAALEEIETLAEELEPDSIAEVVAIAEAAE